MYQWLPQEYNSVQSINCHINQLNKKFSINSPVLNKYYKIFSPYPFLISNHQATELNLLGKIIYKAITKIVQAYGEDHRIQKIISLPENVYQLLKPLFSKQYKLGSFRPDFMIDENNLLQICEINARFSTNGYLLSEQLSQTSKELDYIDRNASKPIASLEQIAAAFSSLLISNDHLIILKGRERGYDIHALKKVLEKAGVSTKLCKPTEISACGEKLYHKGSAISNIFLELHQDELLDLNPEIMQWLLKNPDLFCDLRTPFIAHDKRLLTILRQKDIMQDYLDLHEIEIILKHIIPTYTITSYPEKFKAALENPQDWILKRYDSGKGKGMLIGQDVCDTEWTNALLNKSDNYVLQPYIVQKEFSIVTSNEECVCENMKIVGMLLCLGDKVFGPGVFRASTGKIVNVALGGVILMPRIKV